MSSDYLSYGDRLVDQNVTNDSELSPIFGYQSELVVSLERATQPIESLIDSLVKYVKFAKEHCYYPNDHGLTRDQSASVYLYTMEWGNNSFYRVLNSALRTKDRSTLKRWFAFLKRFDTALKLLPHLEQNVWRGVRSPLTDEYNKGDELIWWSVNSCSLDVHIIKHFIGTNGTLFLIEALNARDITGYTKYPNEHEVILVPGIRLQVVTNPLKHSGGLHIVHLREVPPDPLLPIKDGAKSKRKGWSHRLYNRKFFIIITAILIVFGTIIGLIIGFTKRKKNSSTMESITELNTLNISPNCTEIDNVTLCITSTPESPTLLSSRTMISLPSSMPTIMNKQLFGTQTSNPDLQLNISLLLNLGIEIFRIIVSWRQLEEHGKNDMSSLYLGRLDNTILLMEQNNIRVLICMVETPCWASSSLLLRCDQFKYRPKDYNDYADAMAFLLQRYKQRIYALEIWNEPNLSENWLRPECELDNGLCPRSAHLNDQYSQFIDLIGAQEYSNLVKITYKKMKSIDSNVIILAGSLLGSDTEYLNEMYKNNIKNNMNGLSIHPYISPYRKPTLQDAEEYGPDQCSSNNISSNFWCFQKGVEQIREQMIVENDTSKLIWITEFGFNSSNAQTPNGVQRQTNYLADAIDIIQQQWPFVHVACYYEISAQGERTLRKGLFGLYDKNFQKKLTVTMFIRKVKYKHLQSTIPSTPRTTLQSTVSSPLSLYPVGVIDTYIPYFSWESVPTAQFYRLWVNDYGFPNIGGRINNYYTPSDANCPLNDGQICRVTPLIKFTKNGGQWWVEAFSNNGHTIESTVNGTFQIG